MTEDQSSIENFSTFIENVKLPPGVYKILLKQSVSANHLVQMYSDLSICFPFSFYIEYTELQSSKINPLTSVNPSELTSHNSLQSLVLILTFLHPITGSVDSRNFYLNSEEIDEKVHPIYALRQESLQKVKLKFQTNSLKPGTCYNLVIKSKSIQSEGVFHKYCTMECLCNPKSNAECTKNKKCICPTPFDGKDCYGCIEGYEAKSDSCIQTIDQSPSILSTKFNVQSPVSRLQIIKLYILFSSSPYDLNLNKITVFNNEALINSFVLRSGVVTIKPVYALALNKSSLK